MERPRSQFVKLSVRLGVPSFLQTFHPAIGQLLWHAGEVMWRKGLVRLGGAAGPLLAYPRPPRGSKK